jgi:type 2 lantibiotic biosynthesis protein LanM
LERRAEFRAVLPWFAEDEVRVIVRPTRAYAALYQESFHPDLLRSESEQLAFFDRLQEAVAFRPDLNRLIAAERRDLINGDIPLFCTRPAAQCVWDSSHERIDNYFDEPGMAVAERRLAQLSENDLERQLWVVRASLATLAAHTDGPLNQVPCSSREPLPTSAGELLAAAMQIGNRLADLALTTDDEATWIGLEIAAHDQWSLSPLATDLYDGLPGVILFLAYLGELSQDARYSRLANSALNALRRRTHQGEQTKQIGAFSGLGGMIYLATHLGVLWKDAALLSEAEEFAASIPALVEHDTVLDVIGGAAGCALALLGLYKSRGSARTLEASRTCGEHLLRAAQPMERGIAWLCSNQTTPLLAGFAHGNAGIAYALFELAAATGDARFYHAATQAVTYERSLYCAEVRNWRDLRAHAAGGFTTAWCHGAPGIGLARLYSLRHCGDALVRGEIAAALATTSVAESGGNHSLCHGELGNGDILLSAAEILQDARWRRRAEQMAAGALAVARERGWVCANPLGVESPGLMTGLAGVGYALLRLAAPVPIPSLLALEPPVLP